MPRHRDGGLVPGTPALAGDADRRAGEEATDSIMALQLAGGPGAGHRHGSHRCRTVAGEAATETGRLRAGGVRRRLRSAAPLRRGRTPAGADSPRILQDGRPRAGRADLGAEAAAGRGSGDPRTPLPARRGHPVRRLPGRLLQALAAGGRRAAMPNTSSSAACTSWPRAPTSSPSRTRR